MAGSGIGGWGELRVLALLLVSFPGLARPGMSQAARRTENVVLIMLDGVRWHEVFGGADSALLSRSPGGVADTASAHETFWRATESERRRVLFPFLWDSIAVRGQLLGDRRAGSTADVTNGLNFSYPGYNEALTGAADARIDSNDHPANPNVTVFEWLNHQPSLAGKVAAFGTWDAFPRIFNADRAGFPVHAGWQPPFASPRSEAELLLNDLYARTTRIWDDVAYDAFMNVVVRDYVREHQPRLLFIGFGETDVWAHDGQYDRMLRSARENDRMIGDLWALMQALPQYRDHTTFIVTTDHGRGDGGTRWRDHGKDVEGAAAIWLAVIGPDTPPLGRLANASPVTQGQVAATIAALLGYDFRAASPGAAAPITGLLARP